MIRLDSITKTFGDAVLFENASLHIKPQNRVGLIGANGVGKTTLFRIILEKESLTSGNVFCRGGIQIGYVAQEVEKFTGTTILSETLSIFPELFQLEAEIKRLSEEVAAGGNRKDLNRLGNLQEKFEKMDGFGIETRARTILCGLGFRDGQLLDPIHTLSGGWKMRVALAKVLLQSPDVLLLDEPTNHLDLESLIWLEKFLNNYPGSMVLISHDRYFLNRLVTHIAEISRRQITTYTGNYDGYETLKTERLDLLTRQAKNQGKKIAQTERFIERFRAKNTLATRVKSKIKQLEKIERVEIPEEENRTVRFRFPQPARSGLKVAQLTGVRKAYGDNIVYDSLDFSVERGERIALVGPNGAGKSTLMKLMAEEIQPDAGSMVLGHKVDRTYYAQHQQEALDMDRTVLQNIEGLAQQETVTSIRSYLGAFLFTGDEVNKKVKILSGGEKARLAMARLLIYPTNFLMLDEPTNHLDIQSQDVLIDSLKQFTGTLVCISHDRRFINEICTKIVLIEEGGVTEYPGNYDYFIWKREQQEAEAEDTPTEQVVSENKISYEERKSRQRAERKHRRRIEKCEADIKSVERDIETIQQKIDDPGNSQDYSLLQNLMTEKDELQIQLESKYERWMAAQEAPVNYD